MFHVYVFVYYFFTSINQSTKHYAYKHLENILSYTHKLKHALHELFN